MAYARLEATIDGNYSRLAAKLQQADRLMEQFLSVPRQVKIEIDPGLIAQLREIRDLRKEIGNGTTRLKIETQSDTSGAKAARSSLEAVAKTAEQTSAKISVVHKNLQELGSGKTGIKLNTRDLVDGLEEIRAGVLRYRNAFNEVDSSKIQATINRLEHFFSGQGIKADAFNRIIPELQRVLELESHIQGQRILDFEIHVDSKGSAQIEKLAVTIDGASAKQKELSNLLDAIGQRGATALIPFIQSAKTLDERLELARQRLAGLGSDKAVAVDSLEAANLRLKERNEIEKAAQKLLDAQARRAQEFADALMRVQMDKAVASAREVSAILKTASEEAARLDANTAAVQRRNLADQIRASGTVASVIGGEKNINVDLLGSASKKGLSTSTLENGTARGPSAAQIRAVVAELDAYDKKAAMAAAETAAIGKAMAQNARQTFKAVDDMDRGFNHIIRQVKATEREEERANRQMTRWGATGQGLQKTLAGIGNTITRWAIGYTVVSNLINLVNAAKYALIDYNDLLDRSRIAFASFLGNSTERADKFLEKLHAFARVTPFDFKDLVPLTQRLVALGVVSQTEIEGKAIPAIRAIGNVAATTLGGKEAIEGITRALGQMSAKATLSSEEMNRQLAEWGVNGWQYLAQKMHKSISDVQALTKKGMIDGRQAALTILEGMDNDPRYKGAMAKLSKTFTGAMSNIREGLTDIIGGATSTQFGVITEKLVALADVLDSPAFQTKAIAALGLLANSLQRMGEMAIWAAQQAADKLPYVITLLSILASAKIISSIQSLGATLALAFGAATTPILVATGAIVGFIAAYRNFPVVQDITDTVVVAVLKGLKLLAQGFAWIGITVSKVLGNILNPLNLIPGQLLDKMGGIGKSIKALRDGWNKMLGADWLDGSVEIAGDYWDSVIESYTKVGSKKMKAFLTSDWKSLFNFDSILSSARQSLGKADLGGAIGPTGSLLKASNDTKRQSKTLDDLARMYDRLAKAAEDSGRRQLDALKGVRDVLREIFGTMQDELAKFGVLNSPLDGVIRRIEKLANLGARAAQIGRTTVHAVEGFMGRAAGARQTAQALRDKASAASTGDESEPSLAASNPVAAGMAAGDTMITSMVRRFNAESPRKLGASCADVASRVLNTLGEKIKYSPNAAQLKRNALAAGWVMVPLGTPGSLNVQSGPGFGKVSLTHVTVGIGGGRVAGSSGYKYQEYDIRRAKGHPFALAPAAGGLRGGLAGARQAALATRIARAAGVNSRVATLDAGDNASGLLQEVMGLLSDLKVNKIAPLPSEWGQPIKDAAGQAHLFQVQMMLANDATQKMLRADLGKNFGPFVKMLREGVWAFEQMLSRQKLMADLQEELAQGTRDARQRGHEDDPFFDLNQKYIQNGVFQVPIFDFMQRRNQIRQRISDEATQQWKQMRQNSLDQLAIGRAGQAFIGANGVDSYGMARAQELLSQKIDYRNTSRMKNLFRAGTEGKDLASLREYNRLLAEFEKHQGTIYDENKGRSREEMVSRQTAEQDRQTDSLRAQLALLKTSTLSETDLSDALEKEAYWRDKIQDYVDAGYTTERATELAKEAAARAQTIRQLDRQIESERQLRQIQVEASLSAAQATAQLKMLGRVPALATSGGLWEFAASRSDAMLEWLSQMEQGQLDEKGYRKNLAAFDTKALAARNLDAGRAVIEAQVRLEEQRAVLLRKSDDLSKEAAQWQAQQVAAQQLGIQLTNGEIRAHEMLLGVLRQIQDVTAQTYLKDLNQQTVLAGVYDPRAQRTIGAIQDARQAGLTDDQISKNLPQILDLKKLQEKRGQIGEVVNGIRDDLAQSFLSIKDSGLSAFDQLFDGIVNRLYQFGSQILTNKIWDWIGGLFGGFLGKTFGGGATPLATGINGGSFGGGGVQLGSHAAGLSRVPYDGYLALLHKNEAVLTAAQATAHRDRTARDAARGNGSSSAPRSDAQNGAVHIENAIFLDSKHKSDVPAAIKTAQTAVRDSRRTVARRAQQIVFNGG